MNGHDQFLPSINVSGMSINVTPQQIASAFWDMGSDQQAEFYEHLGQISSGLLCMQAAHLLAELRRRRRRPDSSCLDGLHAFQTLHNHSDQTECFIDDSVNEAKRYIAGIVAKAKEEIA